MFSLTSILSVSCECHGNQVQSSYLEPLQYSQDTISAKRFGIRTNAVFEVRDTVDLMGKTLWLPQGVLIKHHRGGVISNGVLRGNKTQIESKGDLFNRVKIEGTWEVSIIKSSLFKDLDYDNSLQDVVALSNASIHNTISIEAGEYQLSVKSSGGVGLLIQSNTDVELNGIIRLVSNSFDSYCVLRLAGKDIKVEGNCHVFGDRFTHTGKNGEWGMGVSVAASKVVIKGICIGECWGDCIYIGTKSNDVTIDKCRLTKGRRQGISITSARNVNVRRCIIEDISGTLPECAIDIESNKNDTVDNVVIDNVTIRNCASGIAAYGKASNSRIGLVTVKNCSLRQINKIVMSYSYSDSIFVNRCKIYGNNDEIRITCNKVKNATFTRNYVAVEEGTMKSLKKIIANGKSQKTLVAKECNNLQVKYK